MLGATSKWIKGSGCENIFEKTKSLTCTRNVLQGKGTAVGRGNLIPAHSKYEECETVGEQLESISTPNKFWGPKEPHDLVMATN